MHSRIIFDKKDREITFSFDNYGSLINIKIRVDHDEDPICTLRTGATHYETKEITTAILCPDDNIGIDTESASAIMGYSFYQHSIRACIRGFEDILLKDISGSYYIRQNLALYMVATPRNGIPSYLVERSSSEIREYEIKATKCDDIFPSLPIYSDQENTPPRPHKHKKHSSPHKSKNSDVDSAYTAPTLSQPLLDGDTQLGAPPLHQQESQPENVQSGLSLLYPESQHISLNSLPQDFNLVDLCSGEFGAQSPRRPLGELHDTTHHASGEHEEQTPPKDFLFEDNTP